MAVLCYIAPCSLAEVAIVSEVFTTPIVRAMNV